MVSVSVSVIVSRIVSVSVCASIVNGSGVLFLLLLSLLCVYCCDCV